MWWKIYFWVMLAITILGLFALLNYVPFSLVDSIGILISLVSLFAVYTYVFKKKILKRKQWKIIFWIFIVLFVEEILELYILPKNFIQTSLPFLKGHIPTSSADRLFSWLLSLPSVYAMYKLSLTAPK